jgi:acetylornithine deacetylase/succinyl-diaminopimelate desuccinylase-like protein
MNPGDINSVTELCQALIRIPSENPSGAPHSRGEAQIAQFVAEFLKELGAVVEFEEIAPGRSNVCATFPIRTDRKSRLMFAPHLDTVSAAGMAVDPFAAAVRNGRIYGRGASDTKGPMAAMLWALKSVDLSTLEVAVAFAGLADEEAGQLGAKACAKRRMADFVVVAEPTELDVVFTHKGTAWIRMETTGKSAHASLPEQGVNAIERLVEVFNKLKAHFPQLCPVDHHPVLGSASISIGCVRGGTKINVVPDYCSAEIDIRTLPGQENMVAAIQEFIEASGLPATVSALKVSHPLFTSPENPMVKRLTMIGSKLTGASWFCDAAVFAENGTPGVAVGPGSIAQAHTADEFIEVRELERGAAFFQKFLQSFRMG